MEGRAMMMYVDQKGSSLWLYRCVGLSADDADPFAVPTVRTYYSIITAPPYGLRE